MAKITAFASLEANASPVFFADSCRLILAGDATVPRSGIVQHMWIVGHIHSELSRVREGHARDAHNESTPKVAFVGCPVTCRRWRSSPRRMLMSHPQNGRPYGAVQEVRKQRSTTRGESSPGGPKTKCGASGRVRVRRLARRGAPAGFAHRALIHRGLLRVAGTDGTPYRRAAFSVVYSPIRHSRIPPEKPGCNSTLMRISIASTGSNDTLLKVFFSTP